MLVNVEKRRMQMVRAVIDECVERNTRAATVSSDYAWHILNMLALKDKTSEVGQYYWMAREAEKQAFCAMFDSWKQGKIHL
ncbi:hypothetical protein KSC_046090 [Ktedonobacter sp. SOSP1-52]|uniref:hypothetical protein n=1 Tax=Ktedonobacter sp. SOSP1-52 TaxID=2778366 RepID=UPI001914E12D|nr:hypothetical protein [Ktedonobacter sp. SOSP1-52]GHO65717.1 hypothetical protein KSC_046090 [Ktedonobacter sp. SOSP1-52]